GLRGLGGILAPLGVAGIWIVAAAIVALTVVILVLLGRREPRVPEPGPSASADAGTDAAEATSPVIPAGPNPNRPETISVLAVCGAGMGSSLMLRTTAQRALEEIRVAATL